jgi:hypothetical protein
MDSQRAWQAREPSRIARQRGQQGEYAVSVAIHVDQNRDESMLGASEAAGVLGLDKYSPPIAVWRRHRGLSVPDDAEDSEPAMWGRILEPVIRGKYAVDRQVYVVVPTGSFTRDGWLRATPDGLVDDDSRAGHVVELQRELIPRVFMRSCGGLQVKTCSAWLEDDWRDGPPAKYEVQCRVEMAVCDIPWVDIVCLCGGQKEIGPVRIERDLAIEDRLLTSLSEFWRMVQDGREPSPDHTTTWRLHVSEKMERAMPVMVRADAEMAALVEHLRSARIRRKTCEASEGKLRNDILLRLSAAGATRIDMGDYKITAYKTRGTWTLKAPSAWKEDV